MRYDIALELHHKLVEQFQQPEMLEQYRIWYKQFYGSNITTIGDAPRLISQAETFYVTSAMMTKLEDTFSSLENTLRIDPHMLITEHGFVHFERPWYVDLRGKMDSEWEEPAPYHAMSWMTQKNGVSVQFWCNTSTPEFLDTAEATYPETSFRHDGMPRFLLQMSFFLEFGETYGLPGEPDPEDGSIAIHESPWGKLIYAFWLMCAHPLGRVTSTRATRKARRRATQLPKAGDINIIYLRREVNRDPELRDAVSDYLGPKRRHMVRRHYRRYWCGTGADRHQEWRRIEEFERGEGKLIQTDRLFLLKR